MCNTEEWNVSFDEYEINMIEVIVDGLLLLMGVYLVVGIFFSFYFLFKGMVKLDDGTANTPWHFKLLIWPGTVLMWSVLLTRMLKK